MTVSQLRQMVASTEMQCVYGYRACVQEVNDFLLGTQYDDATRRRIVQHLCRRRPSLVSATATPHALASTRRRVTADDAEPTSAAEHQRMFSYSSADSTTDGATEPCEAGSTAVNHVTDTCNDISELRETSNDSACFDRGEDALLHRVESTDDVGSAAAVDVDGQDTHADQQARDDAALLPVWRPW